MTFPALDDLAQDVNIGHRAWRVYMHLQRSVLDLRTPRTVKVNVLGEALRIRPASISKSLNYLVQSGYLIEHERETRGIRSFTLAWSCKADHVPKRRGPTT